jgi:hypothetical protein
MSAVYFAGDGIDALAGDDYVTDVYAGSAAIRLGPSRTQERERARRNPEVAWAGTRAPCARKSTREARPVPNEHSRSRRRL